MKTKKKKIPQINLMIAISIILIIASLFLLIEKIKQTEEIEITKPLYVHYKTENFELYIAPDENVSNTINEFLASAKKEIHCIVRSLNYLSIEEKLNKSRNEGIKVRLFINSDYAGNKRIYWPSTRFDDHKRKGMLHSNYCVIDGEKIFTGSLILNQNTIEKNLHTFVIIKSEELAKRYNSNFWQLYNNKSNKTGAGKKEIIEINEEIKIKPYFCPYDDCEKIIVEEIENAKERINLAVYSMSDEGIFQAIKKAEKKGVKVHGVMERKGITHTTAPLREIKGIITENIKKQIHTKSFLTDNETVIIGSMNPTYLGTKVNDENILVIHSEKVNELYYEFMETLYNHSKR